MLTEDEKAQLKSEIVAELVRHLEEYYVTQKDLVDSFGMYVNKMSDELLPKLFKRLNGVILEHEERLFSLEMVAVLEDARNRQEVVGEEYSKEWLVLTNVLAAYGKEIRKRIYERFKSVDAPSSCPPDAYKLILRAFRID